MDKQTLDAAIGVRPPSGIDLDAVIDRQRRSAHYRRLGASGAVAVAVLGAVAGVSLHPSFGTPPAHNSPSAAATSSATSSAGGTEERLTRVLREAFARQLPNARLSPLEPGKTPLGVWNACSPQPCRMAVYRAGAHITDAGKTGGIYVDIRDIPPVACTAKEGNRRTGPHGEKVTTIVGRTPTGATYHRACILRADGTGITLDSHNGIANQRAMEPLPGPFPPSLTLEQLAAIGLDPGLTLRP